ncbi:hypothetical protein [Mesorhizobium sp. M1B.F.Ca.ET.045.04.1.1]|uniref:hypothetical protein n=1 Tax=Mesorhizobium sp. M1B.F.Ca.ET.045.04.1.1 TaxID=2493673 RepID=UPI000F74E5C6|nr:hypothetical protein [Mesorhizobium sp. M1B.F.Ca.ET.045.04.1.1]AZO31441.1 hypothetical protein EJ071_31345 [Mesorhizobium sp. M1B.F.Ca.ET.045.04.1.1]
MKIGLISVGGPNNRQIPEVPVVLAVSTNASIGTSTRVMRLAWFVALLCYAVLLTTFHYASTTVWWIASPALMADFIAAAPFQGRVLLPLIVHAIMRVTPWFDVDLLFAAAEVAAWMLLVVVARQALRVFRIETSDLVSGILALTITVPVALHLIVPDLEVHSILGVDGGVLELGKWQTVPFFRYVYDLPAAVFTLALVLCLARFVQAPETGRLMAYLGLFALATVNRETTMFLLPAFLAVCWGVLERRTIATVLAAQVIIFVVIQAAIRWFVPGLPNPYASIPGTNYEIHLTDNLGLFTNPLYLLTYLARFGAGLYLPILLLHRYLDPVLKRTLLLFGIPFLLSTVLFGRLVEHRVVIEIVPLLWLGAVQAISAWSADQARQSQARERLP